MTANTPCESSPDDWFIEKDGRQYADDSITEEEQKAALRRRRHAKDACFTECYFRTQCLSLAIVDNPPTHGIYGGYYPEELREIRRLRDERQRRRRTVD